MTASKIFLFLCLSFVLGIAISSFFSVSTLLVIGFFALIIILTVASFIFKRAGLLIFSFCVLFSIAGVWRHQYIKNQALNNELIKHNDREEIAVLTGVVEAEPDIRDNNIMLVIAAEQLKSGGEQSPVSGKVLLTAARYPEYQYGDKIKITGTFKTPVQFENFNYKDYLLKDGILSVMYYPNIELISENHGSAVYAKILQFKELLRKSIYRNLSPPQSSILGAMILGDKKNISQDWKQKLNITGVRHITAVSGLHVAILSGILMSLLIYLGFWRGQAFYLAVAGIAFFIIMTGFQPSGIRAGIMGGLFIFGQKIGRLSASSRAIVFAASLMLFFNPLLLKLDVGFQLSFLATMGMIYFMPFIQGWLNFLPKKGNFPFKDILAMTFSAQIFTLPILIYNFGYISLIAPLANVLIVPLLPFIMGGGFAFGLAGMVSGFLGWILSFPVWLSLRYITGIIDWLARFPWAYKATGALHWSWLLLFYLILGAITWRLKERQRLKFLNY